MNGVIICTGPVCDTGLYSPLQKNCHARKDISAIAPHNAAKTIPAIAKLGRPSSEEGEGVVVLVSVVCTKVLEAVVVWF